MDHADLLGDLGPLQASGKTSHWRGNGVRIAEGGGVAHAGGDADGGARDALVANP